MAVYDLRITVQEIKDGGEYAYLATSPDLPNLIVSGETVEEVLALAPHVAEALIASMQAAGDPLPPTSSLQRDWARPPLANPART
jgi:predicted RNase H-like HicB family nuclease